MSRWVRTYVAIADCDALGFDGFRDLRELSGFKPDRDGFASCDIGCLIPLKELETADAVLAALLREEAQREKGHAFAQPLNETKQNHIAESGNASS